MTKTSVLCAHCGRVIQDLHKAWSRGRRHWCSKSCMDDDKTLPSDAAFQAALTETNRMYKNMLRRLAKE